MRNIIGITFIKMTRGHIVEDVMYGRRYSNAFSRHSVLPKFVIYKQDDGTFKITESEYYFQFYDHSDLFSEEQKKEKFVLFDITTKDAMLDEEISNCGESDFIDQIDFCGYWDSIKDKILIYDYNKFRGIYKEQFFIVDINDTSSNTPNGFEYDYEIFLSGYLNQSMELIKI